jgi:hypothetical protein
VINNNSQIDQTNRDVGRGTRVKRKPIGSPVIALIVPTTFPSDLRFANASVPTRRSMRPTAIQIELDFVWSAIRRGPRNSLEVWGGGWQAPTKRSQAGSKPEGTGFKIFLSCNFLIIHANSCKLMQLHDHSYNNCDAMTQ